MARWQLFIRHAHREVSVHAADNGLSDKGRAQGAKLVEYLEAQGRVPTVILSSPKQRCLETAAFVAEWAAGKVKIEPRLNERSHTEDHRTVKLRVKSLFEEVLAQDRVCLVSHGDILPIFGELAGYGAVDVHKGNLFWLEEGDDGPELTGLNAVKYKY